MGIIIAKSAGFCFGVSRAVKMVENLLKTQEKVCTLGEIIHSPQVVDYFSSKGVKIAHDVFDIPKGYSVVVRSHGTTKAILDFLENNKIKYFDATCPFVKKIHKIVYEYSQQGYTILIAGNEFHPEVIGIKGYCCGDAFVYSSAEELEKLLKCNSKIAEKQVCVVSQTTFDLAEWKKSLKIIKKLCTKLNIFDTICNATADRQNEAASLSRRCDLMVIIGGQNSSNTAKLKAVCERYTDAILIESAKKLPVLKIKYADMIGVTAGASTPSDVIREAVNAMTKIVNENEKNLISSEENGFEQMLEESMKAFDSDGIVEGTVMRITPTEVYVDVGRKQTGFIPLEELSNDPIAKPEDVVSIGDKLDLLIMKTNDQEGTIMLSKRRVDAMKAWDKFLDICKNGGIISGKVTNIVKGGVMVVTDGVKVFVPASLVSLRRMENFEKLLNEEVRFKIIEVNKARRRLVGSIRSVLEEERKALADKFWEDAEIGKKYSGQVKSLTKYGAFVDLGGVDGMVHISQLSWTRIKHPSEILKVGDIAEVTIRDMNVETGKVSLGFKKSEDNPWEILKNKYDVGDVIDVTIVNIVPFGAFARVIPGIDGLIHISQISTERVNKVEDVLKVGQTVKAKIINIDFDKKRVGLSMRALIEDEMNKDEVATEDNSESEEVSNEEDA